MSCAGWRKRRRKQARNRNERIADEFRDGEAEGDMSGEDAFLRGLLATPDDAALRSVYADWLEERSDPRAAFVRLDPGIDRIHCVDWLESDGHLAVYVKSYPEVKRFAEERRATAKLRKRLATLRPRIDPAWTAFMDTLACPFRPFFFFNNHGSPREFGPEELPFKEQLGTRGAVVTFASAFRDGSSWDPSLLPDLEFLCRLQPGNCYYGAATCPVHPFLGELQPGRRRVTGASVLAALKARDFRSQHIQSLRATRIPFPGYHPRTDNDEIHNDSTHQHIFVCPGDESEPARDEPNEGEGDAGRADDTHANLTGYVEGGHLWYVLLHGTPYEVYLGIRLSRYVVLFAVGKSPHGDRLVGVVTHQVCHNLCD
jgi:uncharacterized protein (TIGR02996 family)